MKKHSRNTALNTASHHNPALALRRETIRSLTGEDLSVVVAGSSTIITEKPPTTTVYGAC